MSRKPLYSADRASTVVLVMAIAMAIICSTAGIIQLRSGEAYGWLLLVVGAAAIVGAVLVRVSLRNPRNRPEL